MDAVECRLINNFNVELKVHIHQLTNSEALLKLVNREDIERLDANHLIELCLRAQDQNITCKLLSQDKHSLNIRFDPPLKPIDFHGLCSLQTGTIQLANVNKHWKNSSALTDIDFSIHKGEIIALVGPSGSGKSTLLKLIAGALKPSQGIISINDLAIGRMSFKQLQSYRSRLGLIEQSHLLIPQLSVHQNVIAGLIPNWPWYRIVANAIWRMNKDRVHEILQELGIAQYQWTNVSQLSGGQQQRVAVARALICNPDIILADEPTSSLDPRTAEQVCELIVEQARRRHATLLFCTHQIDQVLSQCDRIIGLKNGNIVFNQTSTTFDQELLQQQLYNNEYQYSAIKT